VLAHHDDEVFCAGHLRRELDAGARITLLWATAGGLAPAGRRIAEGDRALAALGLPATAGIDLRLPDQHAVEHVAAIAAEIGRLLAPESGEWVEGREGPRRVEPGDILILVRRRDAFFEAMIRALKEQRIPVAGTDRLDLMNHIAVMDLCVLGKAALLPQDDLTLATLLKSPLIGLDDDDLIAIAPRRSGALIDALAASGNDKHESAAQKIQGWNARAHRLSPCASCR